MLEFKGGVRLRPTEPFVYFILLALDEISERSAVRQCLAYDDLTITSGNDGTHTHGSRHYKDEAVDLRVHNIKPEKRGFLHSYLRQALNAFFSGDAITVLYESATTANAHYHIQPKIGVPFVIPKEFANGYAEVSTRRRSPRAMGRHAAGRVSGEQGSLDIGE